VVATLFSHPIDSLGPAHYLVEDLRGMKATTLADGQGLQLEFTPLEG